MLNFDEKNIIRRARDERATRIAALHKANSSSIDALSEELNQLRKQFARTKAASAQAGREFPDTPPKAERAKVERAMRKAEKRVDRLGQSMQELKRTLADASKYLSLTAKRRIAADLEDQHTDDLLERALAILEHQNSLLLRCLRETAGIRRDMEKLEKLLGKAAR